MTRAEKMQYERAAMLCWLSHLPRAFVMHKKRRILFTLIASMALTSLTACQSTPSSVAVSKPLYGLIGKIKTKPGQRDALAAILVQATRSMPGCLSYVVALDAGDENALWITEVWDSPQSHTASLNLPEVKAAMQTGRPMIAGFGERFETHPVGGFGTRL